MILKNFLNRSVNGIKSAIKNFPVTVIFIFLLTVIFAFFKDFISNDILEHITIIGFTTIFGTFFTEVLFKEKEEKLYKKNIFYLASLIIGIIFDVLTNSENLKELTIVRWLFEYVSLCSLFSIYIMSKKTDKFEKYILNVYLNVIKNSIVYCIVNIGLLILYGIFYVLIKEIDFDFLLKLIILFTGFYYVPVCLNSLIGEEAEDSKFNRILFTKVFLTLLLLAIVIVYVYIVKIIFITEIPKNEVFMILSFIFVCLLPICIINKNYCNENKVFNKIIKMLSYLFIPFVLLQGYSIGRRIYDYGITEERYFAIIFIIFEIVCLINLIYKDGKKLNVTLIETLIILSVALISPLNYIKVPIYSQKAIINKYINKNMNFTEMDIKDQRKFAGAYQYFKYSEEDVKFDLTQNEIEELNGFSNFRDNSYVDEKEDNNENTTISLYYSDEINGLDVSKYAKIFELAFQRKNNQEYNYNTRKYDSISQDEIVKFEISDSKENIEAELNLKEFIFNIIENYSKNEYAGERYYKENNIVKCDEKYDVYITSLNMEFDKNSNEILNISFRGYILEKI